MLNFQLHFSWVFFWLQFYQDIFFDTNRILLNVTGDICFESPIEIFKVSIPSAQHSENGIVGPAVVGAQRYPEFHNFLVFRLNTLKNTKLVSRLITKFFLIKNRPFRVA